ncbi:MAG TPA: PTS sugar transporter subunit IIA [Tissierellales bacterium]|nr:PTS sugar transporter subunit IIA [Tissierellales bacterium]
MENINIFKEDLIFMNIKGKDRNDVLSILATELYDRGYVKDTYKDAIIQREKNNPTGLPTMGVKVALPHTDTIHVNEPAIALGILEEPVIFEDMGSGEELEVEIVFMLAVKNPSAQVKVLKKLIDLFQDSEFLISLKNSENKSEAYRLIQENL